MSKLVLSYIFKTNLATFRAAIFDDNTDRICRLLDIEREYLTIPIDNEGNTALILAIHHASSLTVRLLLEQGAQPDQSNPVTQHTPLAIIAMKTYEDFQSHKAQRMLEKAKILLEYGAYVDKPSLRIYQDEIQREYTAKETPLMIACRRGNLPLVKLLIEKQANVNYIERHSQIRSIHSAINNGDEAMFDILVNAGALCCSILSSGENNLLHWFCYKTENDQYIDLLKKILDQGCSINAQNWKQRTPLMLAIESNMIETCRILLKNKASIDLKDANGNQAMDLAIPGSECSKLLIEFIKDNSIIMIDSNEKLIWRKRISSNRKYSDQHDSDESKIKSTIEFENIHSVERRDSGLSDSKSSRRRARDASHKLLNKIIKSRSQSFDPRKAYIS